MNLSYFIAQRIHFQQNKKHVSRPAVRIAMLAIALGMAVMIIAVAVVLGFKYEVRNKVIGFGGHVRISNYDSNNSYETNPIVADSALEQKIIVLPNVKHVEPYATKPGIIKTETEFQGIVLKGIDANFDWSFFQSNLIAGSILNNTDSLRNEILISSYLANLLQLKLGDTFFTYFISHQIRARKFEIVGIYRTNFVEYDKLFLLTDLRHVQQLNNWNQNQYSGYEVLLSDFDALDMTGEAINKLASTTFNGEKRLYYTQTIRELAPNIFGWLDLLDVNVWVILGLMLAVAGFNMISGLLILILERTNMIGILKAVGANNWTVRKVFLYHALFLIGKGMFWGNVVGIAFCALQYYTGILPLDPEAYYVSTVPIRFQWGFIILLNIGTFVASVAMMLLPSYLITKISPAKIIRYE
ncbi:MAG: ABC transporter permease [Porphyromonadaceae bacterium CG2_30_38_12]|nr:MAG: ABC transporter permease [Porphyromonadaceae bacterium CG2_30_38_12]